MGVVGRGCVVGPGTTSSSPGSVGRRSPSKRGGENPDPRPQDGHGGWGGRETSGETLGLDSSGPSVGVEGLPVTRVSKTHFRTHRTRPGSRVQSRGSPHETPSIPTRRGRGGTRTESRGPGVHCLSPHRPRNFVSPCQSSFPHRSGLGFHSHPVLPVCRLGFPVTTKSPALPSSSSAPWYVPLPTPPSPDLDSNPSHRGPDPLGVFPDFTGGCESRTRRPGRGRSFGEARSWPRGPHGGRVSTTRVPLRSDESGTPTTPSPTNINCKTGPGRTTHVRMIIPSLPGPP